MKRPQLPAAPRLGPPPIKRIMAPAEQLRRMGLMPTMVAGLVVVVLFFGAFGAWAALVPIDSAAVAQGVISVNSRRKTVAHLEGGIVKEILVDEGSVVEAGDVVIRLDDTQAAITLDLLRGQLSAGEALAARLKAERDDLPGVAFPDWLIAEAAGDAEVEKMLAGQERIFAARRDGLSSREAILLQRVRQLEEEIGGLKAEIKTQDRQLALIAEEVGTVSHLVEVGLALRPRLLGLQRDSATIEGNRAQNRARIARARQSIGETHLQISDLRTTMLNDVVQELRDVEDKIDDARERIAAARDVRRRTEIIAPVAGTVINLQVFTPGGIIGAGEPLMDIVPLDDELIIEARVKPNDIDVVFPGLEAVVRLTAYSQRITPAFIGVVRQVSADRLTDQRSGEAFYLARIALQDGQPGLDQITLHPGMPAEVLIKTGERSTLAYLLKPITRSLQRSLRED